MRDFRSGLPAKAWDWSVRRLRDSPLFPVSMPDKRTDTDALGHPFACEVLVFFPNTTTNLYQIRAWYEALRALTAVHPVVVVFRDSRTAAVVRRESRLTCVTLARYGQLDEILSLSDVKLCLYVNHDPINFECLRFTSMVHVYLGHGDSDKGVSVSNQVKAYDFCFLAGQAARERLANNVMLYDAAKRTLLIGQPTTDVPLPKGHPDPTRRTVLYAPTWEASQPSVSYGSVKQRGVAIVEALSPTYRVIYRPHPLNGVIDRSYGDADQAVRALADRVDTDNTLEESFADADLLITDISAVALSWLPTGRPILVNKPHVPYPHSRIMEVLPLITDDTDVAAEVELHLRLDPTAHQRRELTFYYLSDTTPGTPTAHFVEACASLIQQRDEQWAALRALGATGP